MILQTEDCIGCLTTIFGNQYEYVFLFDHSSGHAKKRVGGLNVTSMTKGFGGELLRNTKIERSDGYLGPFHNINNPKMVQVGDEQQMVYSVGTHGDDGLSYRTPEKREALRNSNKFLLPPEKQGEKDKTKRELVEEMMNTPLGIATGRNALSNMLLQDLQKSAANLGIDTKKHVTHRTVSGWEGRGKGMLQVL